MLNKLLKFSQRVLRKVGTDLVTTANNLPVRDLPTPGQKEQLKANQVLRNKHRGQRCFIVGTGPSIARQDLSPLKNELTFGMNAFWQHDIVEEWQPTYYLLADGIYFDGSPNSVNFLKGMRARVPDSTYFAPLKYRDSILQSELLPADHTYWLAFGQEFHDPGIKTDLIDFTGIIPAPRSVSQLCIMAAIYMGCSPIYLLGLDHDWLAHMGENRHFYKGHSGFEGHPKLRPVLADWGYRGNMESQLILWTGYEKLQDIAIGENCQIINVTDGGFLDVFERASYEEIVGTPTHHSAALVEPH
jgi:hypothetical protein